MNMIYIVRQRQACSFDLNMYDLNRIVTETTYRYYISQQSVRHHVSNTLPLLQGQDGSDTSTSGGGADDLGAV